MQLYSDTWETLQLIRSVLKYKVLRTQDGKASVLVFCVICAPTNHCAGFFLAVFAAGKKERKRSVFVFFVFGIWH